MIREYLIKLLGGEVKPKLKDGQYYRKPSVCKNPVRKHETNTDKENIKETTEAQPRFSEDDPPDGWDMPTVQEPGRLPGASETSH